MSEGHFIAVIKVLSKTQEVFSMNHCTFMKKHDNRFSEGKSTEGINSLFLYMNIKIYNRRNTWN